MRKISLLIGLLLVACDIQSAERNNMGNILLHDGLFNDARLAYYAAQIEMPDRAVSYYNAAAASVGLEELEQAKEELATALRTADSDLSAIIYYNLGNVYYLENRFREAIDAYQQALLINPGDQDARYNLELAMLQITTPSPTPTPEGTEPSPSAEAMSTDDATGQGKETETQSPPTAEPGQVLTPDAIPSLVSGLSMEEALRLLDAVQQSQQTLGEQLDDVNSGNAPTGKDW